MNVIVVGGGLVGTHIARTLATEHHDVTLIEQDASRLRQIDGSMDCLTVVGNGASPTVLEEAGAAKADLLVAAAHLDEINLVACAQARKLGAPRTVARIHGVDYLAAGAARLGIDFIINPEEAAALEITRLLEHTWAVDMADFAGGRIEMMAFRLAPGDVPVGKTVLEVGALARQRTFLIAAILREERLIVPHGSTRLLGEDIVYVIGKRGSMSAISFLFGHPDVGLESMAICGGSRVGVHLARRAAELDARCLVIEPDAGRAERCANELEEAVVVHGEGTDPSLLREENIAEVDGFVAVTERDETNLLSAALVQRLGGPKTVALLQREDFRQLADEMGISATVSTAAATADAILKFLRRGVVNTVTTILGGAGEISEMVLPRGAAVLGTPLSGLKLPEGILVGAILRKDGSVEIPRGDSQLAAGETVVVIAPAGAEEDLDRLFGAGTRTRA